MKNRYSIRQQLKRTFSLFIILLIIPSIASVAILTLTTLEFDRHVAHINAANRLISLSADDLTNAMWDITTGSMTYAEGRQEEILKEISACAESLYYPGSSLSARERVEAITNQLPLLEGYVQSFSEVTYNYFAVQRMEENMNEIRGITRIIRQTAQEYIENEMNTIVAMNTRIRTAAVRIAVLTVLLLGAIVLLSVITYRELNDRIQRPIAALETLSNRFAMGELEAQAEGSDVEELEGLTTNMGEMAVHLKELMDSRVEGEKRVRIAEMKTFQEQIKPHFLYNTLDTIIWLAQQDQTDEVVETTMALTKFFRIGLSSGKDFIPVAKEIEQVEAYLQIQAVRYGSILDYEIDVDEALLPCYMLKLLLQPLVENAIYHGIKQKRTRGLVQVYGRALDNGRMQFSVRDDGVGMTPETLSELTADAGSPGPEEKGFALRNVKLRLHLFYPDSELQIKSERGKGTEVSFTIPAKER